VPEVDALQYRFNEGPCVAAIYDDGVVVCGDVTDDERWPRWGPEAAGHGVRAALSVNLYTNRGTFGALNLYMRDVRDCTSDDVVLAKIFASHVSIVLAHYRNDQDLWKGR
jgi:GAF domain-containing protein